jgi:two-component system, NtrC family, nitrogen regulation sensor histidine kinase NtrY
MQVQPAKDNLARSVPFALPRDGRRLWAAPGIVAIAGALLSAAASFAVLLGLTPIRPDDQTTTVLIAVIAAFVVALLFLIGREIYRIVQARKRGKAASRLHIRVVTMFALVAALPALVVAIIASITLDLGLDRWFEIRTKTIVNSSISLARAYVEENARNLQGTSLSMAYDLDRARALYSLDRGGFTQLVTNQAVGRSLIGASLVKQDGSVLFKADVPTDIPLPEVPLSVLETAADGKPVLIPPRFRNLMGAVVKLREIPEAYLYTLRLVDPEVIKSLRLMEANTEEYQNLESNRTNTQVAFALLYLGLALTILLSAIWTGIAVADRLVRPIRQLITAAEDVSGGNLDVAVPVRASDGDVGFFADTFNKMVGQIKSQRDDLVQASAQIDERRRFSEAVLSGVTAGVISVDGDGRIAIFNKSTEAMFDIDGGRAEQKLIAEVLPEIGKVFHVAAASNRDFYREQITFSRRGRERSYNVQITMEESGAESHSYVITIDDITDLVEAQRSTAWADVARRIAHEIKNPLTPIQLSAERIRRRYGKIITEDREIFDQCTDTIIRQVGDIGRMVDEFSAFARMPKPTMERIDLRAALTEASFLTEVARHDVKVERRFGEKPLYGLFDSRLISQAFGNLIKNAAEAIDSAVLPNGEPGHIRVTAHADGDEIIVDVEDNGKGWPKENRNRLLEPYMTTREKGTGLGLAIVKKIVEDHGGSLELHDAAADFYGGRGACVRIRFAPAARPSRDESGRNEREAGVVKAPALEAELTNGV